MSALRRDPEDRSALLTFGALARLTYDYPAADSLLARVVKLRADDALADYARIEQAGAWVVLGRMGAAAGSYAEAVENAKRRSDTMAETEALLGLAIPRSRLVSPADVLPLITRAEAIMPSQSPLRANAVCQRAALLARGVRPGAAAVADSGIALAKQAGNGRQEGRCWHVRAQTLAAIGDMGWAVAALDSAARLFRRTHDDAALGAVLQWRGYIYITYGNVGVARLFLHEAVAAAERAQAMSVVGWASMNLGQIIAGLGDPAGAMTQLNRAVSLLEAQGDEWGVVTAQGILGGVARLLGDTGAARQAFVRSLAWGQRTGNVATQFAAQNGLASLALQSRDWVGAARQMNLARALARRHGMLHWERGLRYGSGLLALRRGDFATARRELEGNIADLHPSQHAARYRSRALLAETHLRAGNLDRAESEMTAASDDLDQWRASLSDQDLRVRAMQDVEFGGDPDLGVATIIAALANAGRTDVAFRLAERRRARELIDEINRAAVLRDPSDTTTRSEARVFDRQGIDFTQVVQDSGTALVEYVTGKGGEPTTVFVVTRRGIAARQLPPVDSLQSDLSRFILLLESGADPKSMGARLGSILLGSVVGVLDAGITRLVVVPDGILARVPFDALTLPDGRYALERFAIGVAPSAASLIALRTRAPSELGPRVLAFGDPSFSRPVGAADTLDHAGGIVYRSAFADAGGLPRLPSSAAEARAVARYAPASVVRLRNNASEAWLRSTPLDSFRVVHFATHALVDDQAVTRTALALAPGGGHDGFVGPGDLASLSLRADLVVLSACRTAGGEIVGGEGVQGLTAPLLQAGARAVVATQWRIADERAATIVQGLYRALAAGLPVVDALREAKLEALHAGAPPSEWAAFLSVGEPMVRIPLITPAAAVSPTVTSVAIVVALLALGFYGWRIRKRSGSEVA